MFDVRRKLLAVFALTLILACAALGEPPPAGVKDERQSLDGQGRTDLLGDPLPPGALIRLGTTRLRHQDYVSSVALSPDGRLLASAGGDSLIRLWDVVSGRQVNAFAGEQGFMTCVAFSPDGQVLAAGNNENVRLFGVALGARASCLEGRKGAPVHAVAFSPDGKYLAWGSGDHDRAVHVWELGRVMRSREARRMEVPDGDVRAVAFAPNGRTLAACSRPGFDQNHDNFVTLFEVATGKAIWRAEAPSGANALAFSSDGTAIAAAGFAGPVRHYEAVTGKRLPVAPRQAQVLAFALDCKMLWVGARDGTLSLCEPTSGKELRSLRAHMKGMTSLTFSENAKTVAWGSQGGSVTLCDVTTGKELHVLPGHNCQAISIAFAPNGRTLASCGGDQIVCLWDAATGRELRRLEFAPGSNAAADTESPWLAQSIAYSPNGKLLASLGGKSSVQIWEAATGKQRLELRGHRSPVRCLAFTPDGKTLASGDRDGTIRLWEVATGEERHLLHWTQAGGRFREQVLSVAFSPDGKIVAAGCSNRIIRLWDTATGSLLSNDLKCWGDSCAFLPDGRTLAALDLGRGEAGVIHLLDVPTGIELGTLGGGSGVLQAIALSADGKLLASAGTTDKTVRVWEVATGQEVLHLEGHESGVLAVAFSPDGKTLASASSDTTGLIWDLLAPGKANSVEARKRLRPEELDRLWRDLGSPDGASAYCAGCSLVAAGEQAIALLKEHLRPAAEDRRKAVARLVTELNDEEFGVREAASKELRARGKEVEYALRVAVQETPSPEARRRLEQLLEVARRAAPDAETLRLGRAVQVLERLGSHPARQLLRYLAQGASGSKQTQEARAALGRLGDGTAKP